MAATGRHSTESLDPSWYESTRVWNRTGLERECIQASYPVQTGSTRPYPPGGKSATRSGSPLASRQDSWEEWVYRQAAAGRLPGRF